MTNPKLKSERHIFKLTNKTSYNEKKTDASITNVTAAFKKVPHFAYFNSEKNHVKV